MKSPLPQRRMPAEDRREQILDIVHAVVDREGFHAATLNRIAMEAGVTRTVVYQQFGDLAGVFVALIDRERERALAQFAEAVVAGGGPTEAEGPFGRTFAGVLRAIDTYPSTWRLFLEPPEGAPPELHQRLAEAQARVDEYLERALSAIVPDFPDVALTARVLRAGGTELLRLHLEDPDAGSRERMLALVRRLTLALVRPPR
ncbi:MAG TPA: TetR/AcrR family transcriptional regulator [Polyangiales bacterium]